MKDNDMKKPAPLSIIVCTENKRSRVHPPLSSIMTHGHLSPPQLGTTVPHYFHETRQQQNKSAAKHNHLLQVSKYLRVNKAV